jgi:hypothetical protein
LHNEDIHEFKRSRRQKQKRLEWIGHPVRMEGKLRRYIRANRKDEEEWDDLHSDGCRKMDKWRQKAVDRAGWE